jgi:small subunit ribosomal protein S16
MVTIRLARHGAKKNPFYHVTIADRSKSRNGSFVERVGFYNPVAKGKAESLRLDLARIDYWLSVGAKPSEMVKKLINQVRRAQSQAETDAPAEPASAT